MIYLDNAATTKMDSRVLQAMMPYLTEYYGNAGSLYALGNQSAKAIEIAREQVASLIGAKPEQIIFTSGGTEANNQVFAGTAAYLADANKTVLVSEVEHDSVLEAHTWWYSTLADRRVSCTADGCVKVSELLESIDRDVGLVSIMHTNNETGVVNPVKQLVETAHAKGALFHTDCVQALSCHKIDVEDLGCDFLSISSHKIHGPKGVGALYVRDPKTILPMIHGGKRQEFGLRGGTENTAGIVGFGKACSLLKSSLKEDGIFCTSLTNLLYDKIVSNLDAFGLDDIVHRNGRAERVTKILNLRFDGVDGQTLVLALGSAGVCASAGSACRSHASDPSHVLVALGLEPERARSSIRFSVSRDNTEEEIESAAETIVKTVAALREKR
ncbi:MAG: cysteine desulfurase [Oscillospiraceae bacterium]|nr:cysteine desulfurase [Oscillospiraceae bacterium]